MEAEGTDGAGVWPQKGGLQSLAQGREEGGMKGSSRGRENKGLLLRAVNNLSTVVKMHALYLSGAADLRAWLSLAQ